MRTTIGVRASPTQVSYCILTGNENEFEITILDRIVIPKALDIPEQLKFIRNTLTDIINENKVTNACIRITESNAQSISITRIYLEGVIQELIASCTIERYYIGQISSISARLGIDRAEFKPLIAGESTYMDIVTWKKMISEERESLLAAASAFNL